MSSPLNLNKRWLGKSSTMHCWGHPVTSGLPTIDYYLSSQLMEPENAQALLREADSSTKLAFLTLSHLLGN